MFLFLKKFKSLFIILPWALIALVSSAYSAEIGPKDKSKSFATSSGGDYNESYYSSYVAMLWSPMSSLNENGLRVKAGGSYTNYNYLSSNNQIQHIGEGLSAELLVGYAYSYKQFFIKSYIGISYADHIISPYDPDNKVSGLSFGAKFTSEIWLNISNTLWTSLDVSYSTNYGEYWLQSRTGLKPRSKLSLGPEISLFGHDYYNDSRLGLFGRLETDYADITLSAGGQGDDFSSVYLSIGVYKPF